ncbi:type III secretion system stator protein SctL [Tanticharoenia sakaeratensis]|uniref:Type 3 secretion system stator protein n=1 Tax=Tanticharoenia sakaeratensis NBRC 103193 TaxID=1231623 RepID=A0A0D6MQX2_9PROT|nr:type III secretion system stator protein SctL [Tanticharoenia sakaeratensis]GAN55816.1 NolV protein [Tanticharoenia sakaeratensis NBRC 103193]GBQ24560.1 type III secretion system protein [Tanticharoenia sakaeratensis NBRC 103193]
MSDGFASLRPATVILTPEEMGVWCDAGTAYRAAIADAQALRAQAGAACEAARQRGYEDGLARAATDMARHILATSDAAARVLHDIETGLADIVADVVEDMLGRVDLDEVLPIAIRHGLGRVRRDTGACLRIAPDCVAALRPLSDELQATGSLIRIEVDAEFGPGRCVLESEYGTAELGLQAQVRVLRERLGARWQEATVPTGDSQTPPGGSTA